MRTSRLSKDASRLFSAMPQPDAAAGPRRSARPSLARFSYRDASSSPGSPGPASPAPSSPLSDLSFGSDIEDAVRPSASPPPPPPPAAARRATRKRKRTSTAVAAGPGGPAAEVKTEAETEAATTSAARPAGARRKPARAAAGPETAAAPPPGWEEMYAVAKEMRLRGAAANAAVDTMGCERLADPGASPRDRRFQTLVALMLSSQTKDTVNAAAMRRLKEELPPCGEGAPPGLNLENMLAVDPGRLNEMIWQVGFHNNKTKYLKQAAVLLRDRFGSDIPPTIEGLTSLPGVGPKMAHLCMAADNGWGRVEGIGVDVHVHRITNLWGWHRTGSPEATRLALQAWLPRDRWREVNWLLVGLGQAVCRPVGRRCGDCALGLRGLCPAAERKKVAEGRRRREEAARLKLAGGGEGAAGGEWKAEGVVVKEEQEEGGDVVVKEEVVDGEVPEGAPAAPETGPKRPKR